MRNKTILSVALACLSGLTAHAQLNGNGYYRVVNATTGRYMSLTDNTSRGLSITTTSVDAGALLTKKNWEEVSTDPGSVFYIENKGGDLYNISGQGANLYSMIKYYIRLKYDSSNNLYRAWQSESGATVYLSDENDFTKGEDVGYVDCNTNATLNWKITAVNTGDNYISVKPTLSANGKYYASFYAGFPFSVTSTNMKVYYISSVDESNGVAIYKELSGTIPAGTPVIIESTSSSPSDNKLKLETTNPAAITGNKMTGVYFCLGSRVTAHYNSTPFDASTMRLLSVAADGSLAFSDDDTNAASVIINTTNYPTIKAIPHNTGYLKVSSSCPKTLKLYAEGTYTGIEEVHSEDSNKPSNVYNMNGMIVRRKATSTEGLPSGIYIFKGKKVVVK